MGVVLAKRDTRRQCWARLKLTNGDRILISIAKSGVCIFKLMLFGALPYRTLWSAEDPLEIDEKFPPAGGSERLLDWITEKVIDCQSAEGVRLLLAETTHPSANEV